MGKDAHGVEPANDDDGQTQPFSPIMHCEGGEILYRLNVFSVKATGHVLE
jgi:hypothetical protein